MTDWKIQNVEMLLLLWMLPVVVAFLFYAAQGRKKRLALFSKAGLSGKLSMPVNTAARRWKNFIVLAALLLIVLGLTRPGIGPVETVVERRGRDVVFVLDVSRSMLAGDLAPNRLERAKLAIADCLEKLRGDRVGLMAFAGTPVVLCPLTTDYGFFKMILEEVSTDSVQRGGTMIGDAIRRAVDEMFDDKEMKYKDIILITDGEDQGSFPVEAAEHAGSSGIRLIAVGLGDETEGTRISVADPDGRRGFVSYQGEYVRSRLDPETLRQMAAMTPGGLYFNVATGDIDLGAVYETLRDSAGVGELGAQVIRRYRETFQLFLAVALVLLFVEPFINERVKEM